VVIAIAIKNTFSNNARVVKCKGLFAKLTLGCHEGEKMDKSPHKSDLVSVNGIKLHYLDWGGEGETLLFLTGMGNSAHIYDNFAPRFTNKFRVLALTRRGHGDSDYPETGYDVHTLTEDVHLFLDKLNIDKAILVGHSMAYVEQCHMCTVHPERVSKLICLDAAYDRTKFKVFAEKNPLKDVKVPEQDCHSIDEYIAYIKRIQPDLAEMWSELWDEETRHCVSTTSDGKVVDRMSDELGATIMSTLRNYVPEEAEIKVPILSFYAIWDNSLLPDYLTNEQKELSIEFHNTVRLPVQRECIELFRQNVAHAQIVEIPRGNHYCFIKHEDLVYDEMRSFLL
jgi:pimeloyl-ACP methyl ester carboxylesterase